MEFFLLIYRSPCFVLLFLYEVLHDLPALIKSGLLLVLRCFERLKIPLYTVLPNERWKGWNATSCYRFSLRCAIGRHKQSWAPTNGKSKHNTDSKQLTPANRHPTTRNQLQLPHCKEDPIYVFLSWELRGLSPNFHIKVYVSDLYIPRIGPHIYPAAE